MKHASQYPVRAVAQLTGISIDTLRAWERRYGAVVPGRDARGRMYSQADVARLRLLQEAVARGHPIGRVARLSDPELRTLTEPVLPAHPDVAPRPSSALVGPASLAAAIERLDQSDVEAQLARAAALLRPADLVSDVMMPALRHVGETWHSRPLGIAQEHLLSSAVRSLLGSLMHLYDRSDVPGRLLFATPAGERHEFGALAAALVARSGGLGAIYLGPDLPADDIADMAAVVEADVVVLGVTMSGGEGDRVDKEVQSIARRLPRDAELWLGGPAAERVGDVLKSRALVLPDFARLEAQLAAIGARF
jgi:DNA-binding transcriptional MerR regulator/methylmalonyl-CoA mutase cobalamin-binding subunit